MNTRAGMLRRFSRCTPIESLLESAAFYMKYPDWAQGHFETCYDCLALLAGMAHENGHTELSDSIVRRFNGLFE